MNTRIPLLSLRVTNHIPRDLCRLSAVLVPLVFFILIPLSCTPTGPDTRHFSESASVGNDVAAENIMPWVRTLAAAHTGDTHLIDNTGFDPGDKYPSDHLTRDSAVKVVVAAFQSMKYVPRFVTLGTGAQAAHNVVAEWPGTSPGSGVLLVGVHLDAFYAGADDNGSAVAAMLETARVVRLHRFAHTIRFVAFDLEEFGGLGSTRYVNGGYADDVTAAIVLDLVGYSSGSPGSQKDLMGIRLPDTGDFLFVIGNEQSSDMAQRMVAMGNSSGLSKLFGLITPGDGTYFFSSAFMRSDHALLWFRHVPTLFLTDGADFRNPNYHRESDTPETLDPAFLAGNTRALAAAVALFAEVEQ